MTSLRWVVMVCVGVLCVPVSAPGAESDALRALVDRVEARYEQLRDLQADFVQETRIEGFDRPLQSSGRVFLKKPGLLRWDYLEPSVEHMYVRQDQLEMYVPEHNQVLRGDLNMMMATKAPLQLLRGVGKLTEHFVVRPTADGKVGEGALPLLVLVPRTASGSEPSSIVKVVSEIQPDTYLIQTLTLHEVSGNVSTFRFSSFKTDTGLDESVFILDPPEGTVIVEDGFPQG
ncbi:MAG: outer membrane lipoprotein carrier protein LolA [Nitrospira sp.]|nr:outer membrane lipoprotein carrier protein LolA [Nitrospira sp.]